MEKQLFEQTRTETEEPEKTEVQSKSEQVSLGKFRDAETLLGAYNSLQAEFTKRCQRVKELEGLLASFDKTEKANDNVKTVAGANTSATAGVKAGATATSTQTFGLTGTMNAEVDSKSVPQAGAEGINSTPKNAVSEEDRENILKEYLKGVAGKKQTAIIMDGFGSGLKTLAKKPKTFAEAGDIVREMFKN